MGGLPGTGSLSNLDHRDTLSTIGCMVALAVLLAAASIFERHVLPCAQGEFLHARTLDALIAVGAYLAISLAAYFRPRSLASWKLSAVGTLLPACFAVAVSVAAATGGALPLVLGVAVHALANAWATFLFACSLTRLPSIRAAAVAVVGGIVIRQFALPLYSLPLGLLGGGLAIFILLTAAVLPLTRINGSLFSELGNKDSLDSLELTNPLSALRPPNLLFFATFLVPLTYSFLNVFGVPGLSARRLIVVALMLGLLYLLLIQQEGQEDRLFSLTVLFIMAGLLVAPLQLGDDNFVSHTLLFLGSTCFDSLVWLLMFSLGKRNVVTMMFCFGVADSLEMAGRATGDNLGRLALSMVGSSDLKGAQAVVLCLALVFFAFVWLGFKRFSFTQAIRGVEPIEAIGRVRGLEDDGVQMAGTDIGAIGIDAGEPLNERDAVSGGTARLETTAGYAQRCQELAARGSLTPREVEVFELLVRGRNARFIMDDLHITRNTAKAHIAHIYTKLGVHSHQELLSLVEEGPA